MASLDQGSEDIQKAFGLCERCRVDELNMSLNENEFSEGAF